MSGAALAIGFIGLGAMGDPMARRIAGAGYSLTLQDADRKRADALVAAGIGTAAPSPADVAARCSVIITMLPTSAIVDTVLNGPGGVLARLAPGSVVIDMSSGVPSHTKRLAVEVAAAGGTLIDAPVSGGVPRARTGDLAIMAGGDAATIDRVEPVLKTMGQTVLRTGPAGSAHAMKSLNNLVSAAGFLAGVEAMLVGQQFGIDPAIVVDVLNASTGVNNSTQKKFKQFVLSRAFSSGFSLDLMVKDLTIARDLARETGVAAPFSEHCQATWAAAIEALGQGRDHTELARAVELAAGVELKSQG